MSQFCETCGRGALSAQSVSHSNIKTKTRKYINLQVKRIGGRAYKICTRCLRTLVKNPQLIEMAGKVERRLSSRDKKKATKVRGVQTKRKTHPHK
ncbi:MAG: L28 family ribosomal protein [Patescibacteria group bacterium]